MTKEKSELTKDEVYEFVRSRKIVDDDDWYDPETNAFKLGTPATEFADETAWDSLLDLLYAEGKVTFVTDDSPTSSYHTTTTTSYAKKLLLLGLIEERFYFPYDPCPGESGPSCPKPYLAWTKASGFDGR